MGSEEEDHQVNTMKNIVDKYLITTSKINKSGLATLFYHTANTVENEHNAICSVCI